MYWTTYSNKIDFMKMRYDHFMLRCQFLFLNPNESDEEEKEEEEDSFGRELLLNGKVIRE